MELSREQSLDIIDRFRALPYAEHGHTWDGVSCLGLVFLFLRDVAGIKHPFPWPGTEDPAQVTSAISQYFREVKHPESGDVVVMPGAFGEQAHVGIFLHNGHARGVLHACKKRGVIWSKLGTLDVTGYRRHNDL